MLSATGLGALVGSFVLMRFGRSTRAGVLYTIAIIFNGAAIVLFAVAVGVISFRRLREGSHPVPQGHRPESVSEA